MLDSPEGVCTDQVGFEYAATSVPFKYFNMLGARVAPRGKSPGDLFGRSAGSSMPESRHLSNSRPIQICIGWDLVRFVRCVTRSRTAHHHP